MKLLLTLICALPLLAQPVHLSTTDDGSVLYLSTTLRIPGAGQSMASKLFKIDSSGAHLIDDEGNVAPQAPYWDLSRPNVSGDGSRLVYSAHQFCNFGSPCAYDEWSTPKTPPGAPTLFTSADQGTVTMSKNGRYAIIYGTSLDSEISPSLLLVDFATGTRTVIKATPGQVSSTGVVLAYVYSGSTVATLFNPDGTTVPVASAYSMVLSDDGSTVAYRDASTGQTFVKKGSGSATPVAVGNGNTLIGLSNDGSSMLFSLNSLPNNGSLNSVLYYARVDGTGVLKLVTLIDGIAEAILSGDGKTAYVLSGAGAVLKFDTTTGASTPLVGGYFFPPNQGGAAPGSLEIATSSNAAVPTVVGKAPYSTNLAGVTVTVEGHSASILLVNPTAIQFQIPWDAPVSPYPSLVQIGPSSRPEPAGPAVVLPGGGPLFEAAFPVTVYSSYPQVFSVAPFDTVHGIPLFALHPDFSTPVTYLHPALPGETLTMFGSGFGAVSPAIGNGVPETASPLSEVVPGITFSGTLGSSPQFIGGTLAQYFPLTPSYLGLAPGFVGVYQINLPIPLNLPVSESSRLLGIVIGNGATTFTLGSLPLAIP